MGLVAHYSIQSTKRASNDLAALDASVGRRIVDRIRWLSENLDSINPEALTGDMAGLFKLRVGNYRVVYEIFRDRQIILLHWIGHRRDVYKR